MTTFAGQMDFDGPQPFNVEIVPEGEAPAEVRLDHATVPVVPQEISPDRDLYPPRRYGVKARVLR